MIDNIEILIKHFNNVLTPSLSKGVIVDYIKNYIDNNITLGLYSELRGHNVKSKAEFLYHIYMQNNGYKEMPKYKKEENSFYLVIANEEKSSDYIEYIKLLIGDKKLRIISHEELKKVPTFFIDLVLFTGGEDVSPEMYGESVGRFTSFNKQRDDMELNIFNLLKDCPKLGICRGGQFLTVMNGGKLIQHVENHGQTHTTSLVSDENFSTINVSSSHHQMMYPYNLNKEDYKIYGYSEYHRSTVYLNGDNENIEIPLNFVECEIIHYPKTNSLCIQGHPEWLKHEDVFVLETIRLIKKTILTNEK